MKDTATFSPLTLDRLITGRRSRAVARILAIVRNGGPRAEVAVGILVDAGVERSRRMRAIARRSAPGRRPRTPGQVQAERIVVDVWLRLNPAKCSNGPRRRPSYTDAIVAVNAALQLADRSPMSGRGILRVVRRQLSGPW